jgi:tetratricopeptide (TPR) repeat protein
MYRALNGALSGVALVSAKEAPMSRMFLLFTLLALSSAAVFGQKLVVEIDTHEGQLLQAIDNEKDPAVRFGLLQRFAKDFPNHEAVTWVLSHIQTHYLETKEYQKAIATGVKILSIDPLEVSAAHGSLKAAEALKDLPLIKTWSAQTSNIARKAMQSPKPEYGDEEDVANWKQKVEFSRQVEQYSEYSLYFASLQVKDSKTKSSLIEALEQRNPMSEYLAQMRTSQTTVVRQVDIEEAVASAEAQFEKEEWNEDLLLMVTTHYMQKRKETAKIIAYSQKLLDLLETKGKPEEISDSEWDRKKQNMIGTSNWMMGLLYSTQERFPQADKHLRAAIPYLRNSDMIAGAYYHLGYANYRLAEAGDRIKVHDALRFMQMCASINSHVQVQARENIKAIKAEYGMP